MKQLIAPIAIIVALIAFFVIIDRKEFSRHDDVQTVQNESPTTKRKPTISVPETKPVTELKPAVETKPVAETKPVTGAKPVTETKPKTDTKPAEAKPVAETKSAEVKTETKPVVETKPVAETKPVTENKPVETKSIVADKLAPSVVPVVTAEEAERLNAEAMVFAEKHARRMFFAGKGMELVYDDKMNTYTSVSIAASFDDTFKKNGVVKSRSELLTRKVPNGWAIDYNTLKGNCDFNRKDNTYEISSPDGVLKINTPARLVLNTTTGISVELTGKTPETKVRLGIEELGMIRPGKAYVGELSGVFEEECINYEISALEHYDNVRPFLEITGDVTILGLRIYQKELIGTTYLEGEIVERSVLPDPKKSDYPNCRYTVQFSGNVIKGGVPCPKEMALIVDGFENYKTLRTDTLKKGDKIICSIIPYDTLSEEEQSVQQADDLNLFTMDNYYVLGVRKLNDYADGDNALSPNSGIYFFEEEKEYVSCFNKFSNQTVSEENQRTQQNNINKDLKRSIELLADYDSGRITSINESFSKSWTKEKSKDPPNYNRVGACVWRKIGDSFFACPEQYVLLREPKRISKENLECFRALKDLCLSNGVQLIIALVPNLYVVSSRVINKEFRTVPDLQMATYVKQLSEIGIETIYTTDSVIQNSNRYQFSFFYPFNDHPSDTTQDVISDILAERILQYNIDASLDPRLFSIAKAYPRNYENNNFFPDRCDISGNQTGELPSCMQVLYDGKPIEKNKNAPVIVVGNSFIQTPLSYPDSFPSLLSKKISAPIDWVRKEGSGPFTTILSQIVSDPERYLKNKKVIVMYFGVDHLERYGKSMTNIRKIDYSKSILNGKKLITSIEDFDSTCTRYPLEYWNQLPNKHVFLHSKSNRSNTITDFKLSSISPSYDFSKLGVCVIHAVCYQNMKCNLVVNHISQSIPSFWVDSFYSLLSFEITPGTDCISISSESDDMAYFAIKDIQIWQ